MRKYPITYKNKEYEVRWEQDFFCCVSIYEKRKLLGISYFKRMYSEYEHDLRRYLLIDKNNANYHIEEVKALFDLWEAHIELNKEEERVVSMQLKSLAEWDGVIN